MGVLGYLDAGGGDDKRHIESHGKQKCGYAVAVRSGKGFFKSGKGTASAYHAGSERRLCSFRLADYQKKSGDGIKSTRMKNSAFV